MDFGDDDDDGNLVLGVDDDQEEEPPAQEEEEDDDDDVVAVSGPAGQPAAPVESAEPASQGAGAGAAAPGGTPSSSKAGTPKGKVFKDTHGDPNIYSLTGCSKEMAKAYRDLENSVSSVITSAGKQAASELESDCLAKLEDLNRVCDRLCRLAERKKDILAVEKVLLKRNEQQQQENPQEYIQTMAESLCVSRSEFQKILMN